MSTEKESNLVSFAKSELARIADADDEDGMQAMINDHLLKMVQLFGEERHSGFSASYAINMLDRLLRYLPITDIEDTPEDWSEVSEGVFQHKRCSHIFKDKNWFGGQAYNLDGRVFSDDGGKTWFTNANSRIPIEFPYFVPLHPVECFVDKDGNITDE